MEGVVSVLDTELINSAIYRLLENGNADANLTLLSDMFTMTEIIDALNQRQQKFLLDTGIIGTRTTIAATQGVSQYDLPVDNIMPRRLTWITSGGGGGTGYGVGGYGEGGYGVGGTVAGATITALTRVDSWELDNGQSDWPSDDSTPYVLWGALADLLNHDGPAYDPVRGNYCEQRYQEGIELARLVRKGA